jgi:hypothetical protein
MPVSTIFRHIVGFDLVQLSPLRFFRGLFQSLALVLLATEVIILGVVVVLVVVVMVAVEAVIVVVVVACKCCLFE